MKKFLVITIALIMPMFLFGQSYSTLWKAVQEAEEKDLPKTEYEVLQRIVAKAQQEKQYGHLLKAELMGAQTMVAIAPDSLKPEVLRIMARYNQTQDEVLRLVYQTVLYQIDEEQSGLDLDVKKPVLTPAICQLLAKTKEKSFKPFVVVGEDAAVFNNDLLSVIGSELGYYQELRDYYSSVGNQKAVSLLEAHLAVKEYYELPYKTTAAERMAYIDKVLTKWGKWKVTNDLRNERLQLTNAQFRLHYDLRVVRPMQSQQVKLEELRNLQTMTLKVYPVNCEGDIDANLINSKDYKKIEPLLGKPVVDLTKRFAPRPAYEEFDDSLTLKGLPVGMYMVEIATAPATDVVRALYHVTDVYTMAEMQPDGKVRYVVVNATTGQPIAGAHLRIKESVGMREEKTYEVTTNAQGEYFFDTKGVRRSRTVFAYTDADKAGMVLSGTGRYEAYEAGGTLEQTVIFTDRSIYRPGQTLHASALVYQVEKGIEQQVCANKTVHFILRDANRKVIAEKDAVSNAYGVAAVDFTLPATGLTGVFTIQANKHSQHIRVEEYKRPTFHVDFDEYREAYKAGDILSVKGTALSYAGVPVQEAKVSYKVMRRMAFWWSNYNSYYDNTITGYSSEGVEVFKGEATTDADGHYTVKMPLMLPETPYTMFYNFVVIADVTDMAGETHSGQLSLPLGNRKTALSIDIAEKMLKEQAPQATLFVRNAAGQTIEADVRFRLDGGEWHTTAANYEIPFDNFGLGVGEHTIEAQFEDQTLTRKFVIFSLDDEKPAVKTDDWFYQSSTQFANDGTPVTIQVGSSEQNVHIVYSIFAGKQLIEQGAVERSNQLINRQFTYKEAYGNGLLLTFAWVKNGKCYTHNATIQRPMPDKKLTLEWATFRDRLTPGQKEEWTLSIKDAEGKPVDANLMATLYDQSLDQLIDHNWLFTLYLWVPLPSTKWQYVRPFNHPEWGSASWKSLEAGGISFSHFDHYVYPQYYYGIGLRGSRMKLAEAPVMANGVQKNAAADAKVFDVVETAAVDGEVIMAKESIDDAIVEVDDEPKDDVQLRENLNETAFFYPQLTTDQNGRVAIKFTLPESLTTWQFLGFAHTRDLHYGDISAEAVATKDVMIQPNMPRFVREGDKATISARISNTGEKAVQGKAVLKLINAETNAVICEKSQNVSVKAGETKPVTFDINTNGYEPTLLICKMSISGRGFSDGEQHYLPVLPATERVTVALPITQHEPGTEKIDLSKLVPADATNAKLTLEYTNNPVWLMVQALPSVGSPDEDNAISLAASYYANGIGKHIVDQNPQIKSVFAQWQQEEGNSQFTINNSQLEKNQELKELLLSETPWVMDADNETEQKQRLADFFDENLMNNRLDQCVEKLKKLQTADGAWTWYPGMPGSFYMTVAVSDMLVRLNTLTNVQKSTAAMLDSAFGFMGCEIVDLVKELKKAEKDGQKVGFPSYKALQWLYLVTLDGRQLPADVQKANSYLVELLKKDIKNQSIYDKALSAVIFEKLDAQRAQEYAQSLKEYTVYREDMGRYYDTPRAGYSWFDYKIPTQSIAIEALQLLTPNDQQTIGEMQRWLLQQKRTQAWDTPVNSVNAVYAFLKGNEYRLAQSEKMPTINLDVKTVPVPKASAAIGYIKTELPKGKRLTIRKTTDGTSWGAVYAQFFQPAKQVAETGSGLTIKREILNKDMKVGDRVKVRITITADRDYDFVQVVDKRAACMEPVKQLSGYHHGGYITPRDNATCYFYDMLSKGTHVIETEYYVDRAGTYETGTATVECAYSPEFRAVTGSAVLTIK